MNSAGAAALTSWNLKPVSIALLVALGVVYLRGWLRGRRLVRGEHDRERLAAFAAGLLLLFVATESPLDFFDNLFLAAHMAQHLLLMMFIPPLILFARPTLPLLRGLPKAFVKEGLAPFLAWPVVKRAFSFLV
ncbi:MAG TPA: cytochrome c oxidase assembly protein, partial [Bryobacteraceae bacterium]|nr:cytochrome c oxidase assembly protein [Bryobacteraceae bacterium]